VCGQGRLGDARNAVAIAPYLKTVGVIPASGASRRMGQPKAALKLNGRSFIQRVVDALRDGGCDEVMVVVPEHDDAIGFAARETGARLLVNTNPGEGPITSLRLAIESLPDDVEAIAWLPLDYAMVDARIVRTLLGIATADAAPLVIPLHEYSVDGTPREKRGHPAIFARALFAELADPALEGGARAVVHHHLASAALWRVRDPRVVTDIDTPEQYAAVIAGQMQYTDETATGSKERRT